MEHKTLIDLSGVPVVEYGFVDPVGRSRSEHDVQNATAATSIQAQD
jgi:hypothetical protein